MEFKTIETAEEFSEQAEKLWEEKNTSWLNDRLQRAKTQTEESVRSEYKEKISEYEEKIKAYSEQASSSSEKDAMITELQNKLHSYEIGSAKTKVAIEFNIPIEFADRLNGEDEESIRKDAEKMSGFFQNKQQSYTPPLKEQETEAMDAVTQAFLKMNPNIKL